MGLLCAGSMARGISWEHGSFAAGYQRAASVPVFESSRTACDSTKFELTSVSNGSVYRNQLQEPEGQPKAEEPVSSRSWFELRFGVSSFPLRVSAGAAEGWFTVDRSTSLCPGTALPDLRVLLVSGTRQTLLTAGVLGFGIPFGAELVHEVEFYPNPRLQYYEWTKLGLMERFGSGRLALGIQATAKLWECEISSEDTIYVRPSTGPRLGFELSALLETTTRPKLPSCQYGASLGCCQFGSCIGLLSPRDMRYGVRLSYGFGRARIWIDPERGVGQNGTIPSGLDADLGVFGIELYIVVTIL